VACPGLADAIDSGDEAGTRAAVADAAGRTPAGCGAVVLGCTEYELAAGVIAAARPGATLFGSAAAVAAQALRRAGARGGSPAGPPAMSPRAGTVRVLLSGRPADLPAAALRYPEGRLLARLAAGRRADDGRPAWSASA
jgi:glutamate racemase